MSKVVLGYWAIRGLGEPIRMFLEYLGIPYEQVIYTKGNEDQWFKADKLKHLEMNAAANLPYLLDADKLIPESMAIMVYLCHKAGRTDLLGSGINQQTLVATALGIWRDLQRNYNTFMYSTPNKTLEEMRPDLVKSMQGYLHKFEGLLTSNDYLAQVLTYADFVFAEYTQHLWMLLPELEAQFPKVAAHQKRIWELPAIKAYKESGRFHEKPVNWHVAVWTG